MILTATHMPPGTTPADLLAARLGVEFADLARWAARVAARVRRAYGFRPDSPEADDLVAEAHRALVDRCAGFDPDRVPEGGNPLDAFKGYSHDWVRDAARKEAERIRGGGTFHTVRPENRPATVPALGDSSEAVTGTDTTNRTADPVTRVNVNGIPYALPFETLFRPLSAAEHAALESSIVLNGVLDPPTVCTLPEIGPSVIDGANRCTIADRLGITVPVPIDLGELTHEQASEHAAELNIARRQLSPDEIAEQRTQLVTRITLARKSGKPLRAIARENGLRHASSILRMLRAAGYVVDSGVAPATVIGDDGRTQPATKPPATLAATAAAAVRSIDTVLRKINDLITLDRPRVVALAEDCDIPFTSAEPGRPPVWAVINNLTDLRGMLGRIG